MSNEVISTRVRLARNLKDYPFPCRLSEQGRKKVIEKVTSAIRDSNSSIASDFNLIKLDDLTDFSSTSAIRGREQSTKSADLHTTKSLKCTKHF